MQSTCRSSLDLGHVGQRSGFEFKGIIVLFICGFYAICLFLIAALIRWAWSLLPSPVSFFKSKVRYTETEVLEITEEKKQKPLKPRKEANHGWDMWLYRHATDKAWRRDSQPESIPHNGTWWFYCLSCTVLVYSLKRLFVLSHLA